MTSRCCNCPQPGRVRLLLDQGWSVQVREANSMDSPQPAPATSQQLEDFEEELGRRLPRALRALYEAQNGERRSALSYRLLPLHECYWVSKDVWCFWEDRLDPTGMGANYHFADGGVETSYQTYPSVAEFLQHRLETSRLEPQRPDCLTSAERLDCDERRTALLLAFSELGSENTDSIRNYLKDQDEAVVAAACAWLAQAGNKESLRELALLSESSISTVRRASLEAVEKLGGRLWAFRGDDPVATEVTATLAVKEQAFYQSTNYKLFLLPEPGARWEFIYGISGPSNPPAMPESPRERPHMYFGSTDGWGCHYLALEVIANAVDQFLSGHATGLTVRHDEWTMTVEDDGEGYPLEGEDGQRFLCSFHNSPTSDGHAPHVHLVTQGVGLAPVNAVCGDYMVESVRAGQGYRLAYQRGRLVSSQQAELDFDRGTRVRLTLDREIWQAGFERGPLRRQLFDFAHLVPGLKIGLNEECFYAPGGLLDLAEFVPERIGERRYGFSGQSPFLILQFAATGESQGPIRIQSWVNGAATDQHGSHVDGALEALDEIRWRPARLMVHIIMREPRYAGPVKRRLVVPKALRQVRALLRQAFGENGVSSATR